MVRIASVSIMFCSGRFCTSSINLFMEEDSCRGEVVRILYPNFAMKRPKSSSFSVLGCSWIRYTKVFAFCPSFVLPILSATFLLASSINSSISLLASFERLKYTPVGLPFSSMLKRTSMRSNAIAPFWKRAARSFWARSFSINISVLKSPSSPSIMACASSYVKRLSDLITVRPNHCLITSAFSFSSKTAEKQSFSSFGRREHSPLDKCSGSMGIVRSTR